MSRGLIRLREEIERTVEEYHLCPSRLWQVGSRLRDWDNDLHRALQDFRTTLSGNLVDSMRHEDHSACTFDYCEFSSRNFTAVQQYHEPGPHERDGQEATRKHHESKQSLCSLLTGLFREDSLVDAVQKGNPTAWKLDGQSLLRHPLPFMAVSHVWSDGTGVGAWGLGHVNECLYDYFRRLAQRFRCQGIWWDTLCVPQDKVARGKALSIMHLNYQYARVTLVHDLFLRNLPFISARAACLAIVLSSWFSRGWTALELAKSQKVKIIFKDSIRDLDEEILKQAGSDVAADMIRSLRKREVSGIEDILDTLGPRQTSWPKDKAIIAGLLMEIHQPQDGDTFQRDIYQRILLKAKKIQHGHLFHTSATMSAGFSWCPTDLFQLPQARGSPELTINQKGEVLGRWRVVSPEGIREQDCVWNVSHLLIEAKLRDALQENRKQHVLLVRPADADARKGGEAEITSGLLVKVFQSEQPLPNCKCQFVGSLRFHLALQHRTESKEMVVNIGDTEGWKQLGEDEDAWSSIIPYQTTPEDHIGTSPDSVGSGFSKGGRWTSFHYAAWTGDWSLAHARNNRALWDQPDEAGRRPIDLAAERGNNEMVLRFIERGVDPGRGHAARRPHFGPLHRAAWAGSLDTVETLLTNGGDAHAEDSLGSLALHVAADMGYEEVVERLSKEVDISAPDGLGMTPLHLAAMHGHTTMVEQLLRDGADANAMDKIFGWTPLHCAADNGHGAVLELLLPAQHPEALDAHDTKIKWTPLHLAAMNGHEQVVDLLIQNNAFGDPKDEHSWTPLDFAVWKSHKGVVERLVDHLGTSRNSPTEQQEESLDLTALHVLGLHQHHDTISTVLKRYKSEGDSVIEKLDFDVLLSEAVINGYHEAADILIRKGATINEAAGNFVLKGLPGLSINGHPFDKLRGFFTPLQMAARGGFSKTVSVLIENGADVNGTVAFDDDDDYEGGDQKQEQMRVAFRTSALHLAVLRGCIRTVSTLMGNGAAVDAKTWLGYTPLDYAAMTGRTAVVEMLLAGRQPLNNLGGQFKGDSALIHAARCGSTKVVKLLLEKHHSTVKSQFNQAMLHAAGKGQASIVEMLIENGAPVNFRLVGWTPLHWAAAEGMIETMKCLINKGADVNAKIIYASKDDYLFQGVPSQREGGSTVLHLAADVGRVLLSNPETQAQREGAVGLLLEAGAAINSHDARGDTPLHRAVSRGALPIVIKFLQKLDGLSPDEKKLTVDSPGRERRTALHLAAGSEFNPNLQGFIDDLFSEEVDIVRELLRAGADPNMKDEGGHTPLHHAARAGFEDTVKVLLDAGASTNSKDGHGYTPRRLAQDAGHETIVQLLIAREPKTKGLFRRLLR